MSALANPGASALAVLSRQAAAAVGPTQYLTFILGGDVFAIGILAIKEIIEYGGLTAVPMMPDCIRGVINLRGAVVPVLDLAARFGRVSSEVSKRSCIVIVETVVGAEQRVIGVMVDAVNAVLEIGAADIEQAPSFGAKIRSEFIAGIGKVGGKFVILLHIDSVLSSVEIGAPADAGDGPLAAAVAA
jgi:purine-binding chemotaxis protein CheW